MRKPSVAFRFVTCTAIGAATRSTVEALTFRVAVRTPLLDHTWQSGTKAMLLVSSDASGKSLCRRTDSYIAFIYCLHRRRCIVSIGAERIGACGRNVSFG